MPNYSTLYCVIFAAQFFTTASSYFKLNSKAIFDDDFELEYTPIDASSSPNSESNNSVQFNNQFFLQKIDHSRPTDSRTWRQRYFVNDFYYEEGGPVFLFIYGESEARPKWMGKGPQWIGYAKKFNALCFGLEHRFYGQSRPKENTNTINLQYLTTEQVLADIAYFIEGMNNSYNLSSDTKWILFGGSYAGSLVAWARMKYPHLVHGAVASSAPLLAKTDFPEYYQVVERSLKTHSRGHECVKNIALANRHLKRVIRTRPGRSRVSKMFKLCSVLKKNPDDFTTVFEILASNVAFAVQYNKKIFSIQDVCDIMTDDENSPLENYANVNKEVLKRFNESCASPEYTDYVKYLKNDSYENSSQSWRLWFYQTCSAYGFYQTSSKPNDLFGSSFPVTYFIKMCKDVFEVEFDKDFVDSAVDRTNIEYGALKFNTSNVIFVHGRIDPWHSLGLYNQFEPAAYEVITMKGTAHCGDMYPSSEDDSAELKAARQKIVDILKSWLENEKSISSNSTQEVVNFQINGEN